MRTALKNINKQRMNFTAKIERFGTKTGWHGAIIETVLLTHITRTDTNEEVSDHLWFTCGKWSEGLQSGETIAFAARVDHYEKGYKGRRAEELGLATYEWDYRLTRPTQIKIIGEHK